MLTRRAHLHPCPGLQGAALADALGAAGVPYTRKDGTDFWERQEVVDALAFLKVLVNPCNSLAFDRVLTRSGAPIAGGLGEALGRMGAFGGFVRVGGGRRPGGGVQCEGG